MFSALSEQSNVAAADWSALWLAEKWMNCVGTYTHLVIACAGNHLHRINMPSHKDSGGFGACIAHLRPIVVRRGYLLLESPLALMSGLGFGSS